MAKGRVQVKKEQIQTEHMVFALDIGTRSIIGMLGTVEDDKVKVIAIEREEHTERAMIDGQIENIEKVSALAAKVKKRLENKVHFKLNRVSVAAAGRALRTKRADFDLTLPDARIIDDEIISRLEAGAISKAEEAFEEENKAENDTRRFYLVGYTVCQYFLDDYLISSLKDHRGRHVKVDLIATFLPSEVVESLYATMNKIGLEVASITLEPIAAINATIPESLRLLNLVMVDIGAGTSDIAACTGGSVTGYTMATVAGDEITETLMKEYLVDFTTAEEMKTKLAGEEEISFTDILGFERTVACADALRCIQGTLEFLCKEIAGKILEINGASPSAVFLAGGGSKLAGLKEGITQALQMDASRVAVAGNNFRANAFSEEYDLNNPEYATPLGITISSGLNMTHDSFRVILNEKPAKLFRSGSFTVLNLLMMNGYSFQDILGRSGANLTVSVNGRRKVFYGSAALPASLYINKKEGKLSDIVHAGDVIDFIPAVRGMPAKACLRDIDGAQDSPEVALNGRYTSLDTPLKNGDIIMIKLADTPKAARVEKKKESEQPEQLSLELLSEMGYRREAASAADEMPEPQELSVSQDTLISEEIPVQKQDVPSIEEPDLGKDLQTEVAPEAEKEPEKDLQVEAEPESEEMPEPKELPRQEPAQASEIRINTGNILFHLNDKPLHLPRKENGQPYYLMDMIQYSGIDLKNPKGRIRLSVNGDSAMFQQQLFQGDVIRIEEEV